MAVSMVGWWGCGSCGQKVSNGHMGPCLICGGEIRRIVPANVGMDFAVTPPPYRRAFTDTGSYRGRPAFGGVAIRRAYAVR